MEWPLLSFTAQGDAFPEGHFGWLLSFPHLSFGGRGSIWAELEGLLAGEIVFIQCIYNQAPCLSIHLSVSHTDTHTHITQKSVCSEASAHYTLTYTNTIFSTGPLHAVGNAQTEIFSGWSSIFVLFLFLPLCLVTWCTHIWKHHTYSCMHSQRDKHMQSVCKQCQWLTFFFLMDQIFRMLCFFPPRKNVRAAENK